MKIGKRTAADGFASLVSIVISLLITFLLIVFYLREYAASGPSDGAKATTAVDAARKQARAFEEQQRKRLEQMNEVTR